MDWGYLVCSEASCTNMTEDDYYVATNPTTCDQCSASNGDNDGDQGGWAAAVADDCDSDCGIVSITVLSTDYEPVEVSCADGIDNDCDGDVDGNDTDCGVPVVAFSCYINTGCGSDVPVLALSAEENAHAELITGGNYNQFLCCADISAVDTTTGTGDCETVHGPTFTGLIALSGDTNAQVEEYNYTGANGFDSKKNVCVELDGGAEMNCMYTDYVGCDGLPGWDMVVSISNSTNAHIGNGTSYSELVLCCEK